MYLKNIEVQGFKSFANKINFEFHNGITGIVGPNGSGKSNVADAVRWVLGEQRMKQLRGAKMEDVIFSGTENRKPLGFAYVAITLDNSDHELAIAYDEVTVARRVYRSGESEYLINGNSCRLKDINELFYDTGIGKEGYSIIGQGQIDKILSGKPEERRELFDEAAGIVKFKRRKATAVKKLEDERQNILRINDILSELEKQKNPLEKQAGIAKQYLKYKEELKIYDVNMFLREHDRINDLLKENREKEAGLGTELEEANLKLKEIGTEIQKLEVGLEALNKEIEDENGKLHEQDLKKGRLEGEISVFREQIHGARISIEQSKEREERLIKDKEEKKGSAAEYDLEKVKLREEQARMDEEQYGTEERVVELQKNIENKEAAVNEWKSDMMKLLNEKGNIRARIQRYEAMEEQIGIRRAKINQKILKNRSDEAEQEGYLKENLIKLESAEKEQKHLEQREELLAKKEREENDTLLEISKGLSRKQQDYHREKSRLESLKNITERYEGYGNSIRRVMEKKKEYQGIHGVVADIFKVEKKYETAIETALGSSIQNIVTDNEETAKKLIEYLKTNKFGRATFLPLTTVGNRGIFYHEKALSETGVIGLASSLVEMEKKYQALSEYLLGRILVVDHIDHGIAIARKYNYSFRIVTLEGESFNAGGSMAGGAFKNSGNLLGRRREIEELEASVKNILLEVERLTKDIACKEKEKEKITGDLKRTRENLQNQNLEYRTLFMNQKQLEEKQRQIQAEYEDSAAENREMDEQLSKIRENIDKLSFALNEIEKKRSVMENRTEEQNSELERERKRLEEELEKTASARLEYANLVQRLEFIEENRKRIRKEEKRLDEEYEEIISLINKLNTDIAQKEKSIEALQKEIGEISVFCEKQADFIKELSEKKEELTKRSKDGYTKKDETASVIHLLEKESFRFQNQIEKLGTALENQINYMWEEYEITYSSALAFQREDIRGNDLKKKMSELKALIKGLGAVNVNAIEDFKALMERYEFLNTQRDDLIKAEQTLMNIIEELDSGMRKQFEEKFREIQVEFDKVFKRLFGGGRGSLELIEGEDMLECGILIIAQPPGKKLQNMMQLSGGEKALTAISLLFAIQNLKPSPFCLLDEIEAALDDSNVVRFADYLHRLTKNTQFIVITHRRGTMAAADRLYGITMQEKGVSTLVSVNLIENQLDK